MKKHKDMVIKNDKYGSVGNVEVALKLGVK
ncbi:hypothetical protein NIES4075_69010 [Tolypothrix sp. NIES-4075]|nr:hypothetical protein NIES4075_69010 [Tolypothrix sp. NIES-4075]